MADVSMADVTMADVEEVPAHTWPAHRGIDVFGGLTVADLIRHEDCGTGKLPLHYTLGDLAKNLVSTGRTAAVVADCDGNLVGLLTENDVMRAYWEGAVPEDRLSDWLASGAARAPVAKLKRLLVHPSTTLVNVAEIMVSNAVSGDCACHHVVIQEESGRIFGAFSSHDMVKALSKCEHLRGTGTSAAGAAGADGNGHPPSPAGSQVAAAEAAAHVMVSDIMKPRESVFTCALKSSMKEVLKVLLTTHQNAALVVSDDGVFSIMTPRDAVKAFRDGFPNTVVLGDWFRSVAHGPKSRIIGANAHLGEAAALMTEKDINHLVVVQPETSEAVGLVSSLDLVLCGTTRPPFLRGPLSTGPAVGDLVQQSWYHTSVCAQGYTFQQAVEVLASTGDTSAVLTTGSDGSNLALFTENDMMSAYIQGFEHQSPLEEWLLAQDKKRPLVPQHLMVPPSVPLADAVSLVLSASAQTGHACQHLVMMNTEGKCIGVLSALDVIRGFTMLSPETEIQTMSKDAHEVSMVMQPVSSLTQCKGDDTLQSLLKTLVQECRGAAVVVDEQGTPCLDGVLTARCAVKAMAQDLSQDTTVGSIIKGRQPGDTPREVEPTMRLFDAALLMAKHSLHHLVVAERPYCTPPIGVLSSLDLMRGIASINVHSPFVSLAWLRMCNGPQFCMMKATR
eukprot:TRINITY_DN17281_c0_g1_i1.p1 TRINITY_DN17281_c0_g1~~TRINITY_DN17281_c0_g1_i1.p1  ORF type:complete len:675 (-),score=108.42 TRINITY_DN17281_c0_g1_i1:544-2568(-)